MDFFQNPKLEPMDPYVHRLSKRQQTVSSSIAGIGTPGYRTEEISFYAGIRELTQARNQTVQAYREIIGAQVLSFLVTHQH